MGRVVAVANQKGGVAKTTTTHSLGAGLAELGERVLLVDLDPQACLTFSLGIDADGLDRSLHDVLAGRAEAAEVVVKSGDLALLPATIDLAGAEVHLMSRTGREHVLARALKPVVGEYDTVLIDCPPSLGVLTINGLTAAAEVVVPMQCETLGHRGVGQLLETIGDVRSFTNPDLTVRGLVATMFDSRTRHSRELLADLEERYGVPVLGDPIPKSVRFAEAPGRGRSILTHAPRSAGAEAYRAIARLLHEENT
ncbi:MAG: chromosome partitioning protein [Actinomycetota bacterium]|jgi:chromosome partitioning protein|nr:chromosome partitioning protein [Actinomycetota bacterium]MDQ1501424.1 chromosome partitioning protein [Actinomycetota bacterium]MDQ1508144.1 chromosome partitioning protein [Actinomycetota bacterium]